MALTWFNYLIEGKYNDDALFADMLGNFIVFFISLITSAAFNSGKVFIMLIVGTICGTIVIASISAVICNALRNSKYKTQRDYDLLENQAKVDLEIKRIEAECYKRSLEKELNDEH